MVGDIILGRAIFDKQSAISIQPEAMVESHKQSSAMLIVKRQKSNVEISRLTIVYDAIVLT